jgi:hypothetical protein
MSELYDEQSEMDAVWCDKCMSHHAGFCPDDDELDEGDEWEEEEDHSYGQNDPRHPQYDPSEPGVPEAVKQAIEGRDRNAEWDAEARYQASMDSWLDGGRF